MPRVCASLDENRGDAVGKSRIRQVHRRHVDRQVDSISGFLPALEIAQCRCHHPHRERADRAGTLGVWDEIGRWDEPFLRMAPADERLTPHQLARPRLNLGLIVKFEFVRSNRMAQLTENGEALAVAAVVALEIDADGDTALLGAIKREVGSLQQLGGVVSVGGEDHHPDAYLQLKRYAGVVE